MRENPPGSGNRKFAPPLIVMLAVVHLLLTATLAYQLQSRVVLLEPFKGPARYFLSLGLTLFLVSWADFLLYVAFGWGRPEAWLSWGVLLVPLLCFFGIPGWRGAGRSPPFLPAMIQSLRDFRRWNYWFLFLAGFVLIRFYLSLTVDDAGLIWCNFNFFDTPFHLSVTNAFLESPRFPPMDLDMAPYPLKYHFLADFHLARLVRLGLPALKAIWLMNLVSGTVMIASLWAVFDRWLGLPARWVMLAGFVFLFLNPALVNLVHYFAYHPPFLNAQHIFYGLLGFQYFNFEASLGNLLEPQRGLLFTLPIVFLILHALFGEQGVPVPEQTVPQARVRTLQAFMLICLLPFAHIVAFPVLALSALPALWRHRRWLLSRAWWWGPVLVIGVLQLLYFCAYGPPTNPGYSGWDVGATLPLGEFAGLPRLARRLVFWFFVNGDFFFWGVVFAASALCFRAGPAAKAGSSGRVRQFLRQWGWYFAVCAGFFVLINFYRYSFVWGDSNKFVLFFNLGLTLVIVLGAAQWLGRRSRALSYVFWWFFFLLCAVPPAYNFYWRILLTDHDMILLFTQNDLDAAQWLKTAMQPGDVILTSANDQIHFVTSLAGRPTRVGIYGGSNPYRPDGLGETIRRIYEGGEFQLLPQLNTRFVCISAQERRHYRLHPKWDELMTKGTAVVFHAGGDIDDNTSVYIFDSNRLCAAESAPSVEPQTN